MEIRSAVETDFEDWRLVAENVKFIFRNPVMDEYPAFLEYAFRKLKQNEVFTACDESAQQCVGFIGFSRHFNRITWFGIYDTYRNRGIGTLLLTKALKELDPSKPITVETFRSDYAPGQPARHLYFKMGFQEVDDTLFDDLGNEICKLAILPK
jgi:ribosomal protein S18 acetylase RimI-like enzyme